MSQIRLIIHPHVHVNRSGQNFTISDQATVTHTVHSVVPWPPLPCGYPADVTAYLLANGLARAPLRTRRHVIDALEDATPTERRVIHRWGGSRRFSAPLGRITVVPATLHAITHGWGVAAAVISTVLTITLISIGADVALIADIALAPFLLLVVLAVHEAAHWLTARSRLGPSAGALLISWRTCALVYGSTTPRNKRIIAIAGPAAGCAAALLCALLALGPATTATAAILLVINVLGITPLTADGRDALTPCDSRSDPSADPAGSGS
ncbi:hypothetical protein [Curtobacterium sp. KT1]|uniref:hypothetical protein n=1 Tax=Curtobacterium sp. KT1 TaxID=3372858 RepID=UPI0037BF073D